MRLLILALSLNVFAAGGCKTKSGMVAFEELQAHCAPVFRDARCRCLSQNRNALCLQEEVQNGGTQAECNRLATDEIRLCHAQVAGQALTPEAK